ncbi:Ig-like domain-containing protein [Campylobacter jejuni]|uniref:BIG2 domain-containing protein n=1 Tax=Campylobacter jejuni TaxID=197 RepID=A0A431EEB4_CAMJU|nr:Ig-like domain-containing protein [Campylobacter jejuni]RTJ79597.1 hypothetical protein C3H57_04300 [Campylobacter jejuni]
MAGYNEFKGCLYNDTDYKEARKADEKAFNDEIVEADAPDTDLTLQSDSVTVAEGAQATVTATTKASEVTAESKNKGTATVSVEGGKTIKISGVKAGNTKVTVTADTDGTKPTTKEIAVKVTPAKPATPVLTSSNKVVQAGQQLQLTVQAVDGVTFEASVPQDKGSTSVSNNTITYTAHSPSATENVDVTIKAKKGDQYSDPLTVSVSVQVPVVTTLELNPADKQTIEKGQTKDITVTTNASDFTVESNNTNATVEKGSGKFTITAATKGTSEITVKATANGGSEKAVKLSVEVTEPARD